MKRRAWILGGTLAAGAAAGALFLGRSRDRAHKVSQKRLTHHSGPFALHPGFEAILLSKAGDTLSDGTRSADLPDGMACFKAPNGNWALLRNHELEHDAAQGAYPGGQPDLAFRKNAQGGVSRLIVDAKTLKVISSNMVLTGTLRNCAGGPTPLGWITCEETTDPNHGYAFLCRDTASELAAPYALPNYGRFRHEAVAFDPETARAFLTEDEGQSCLYRFTPRSRSKPFEGRLEAMRVVGRPRLDTATALRPGERVKVDWVPIRDVHGRSAPLRVQGSEQGAASIARGEGAWLDGDGVVFTATSGGQARVGQVMRLDFERDELSIVAEADGTNLNMPDNITVAPWGDFLVAEDNLLGPQHIMGVTQEGRTYPILRNEQSRSELAGVCFSPDGSTLFCNVQADGLTLAIRGPWDELRRAT